MSVQCPSGRPPGSQVPSTQMNPGGHSSVFAQGFLQMPSIHSYPLGHSVSLPLGQEGRQMPLTHSNPSGQGLSVLQPNCGTHLPSKHAKPGGQSFVSLHPKRQTFPSSVGVQMNPGGQESSSVKSHSLTQVPFRQT